MYIDDLMGKGISVIVILELLFYVSASLIPLALPLAILLSSIMVLGNLSENNELTALKASGLSLFKILKPLTSIILIISFLTFLFANYVIPVSNYKWHSLIFDIQNTKIASVLTPGAYSSDLDDFSIKVIDLKDNSFTDITIHDHTDPKTIKTIKAESGRMYKSASGKKIFFELFNGNSFEELEPITPVFDASGKQQVYRTHPARRSTFEKAKYAIDVSGFDLNHSQQEMFKDKYEMLNVFQINNAIDSVQASSEKIVSNFHKSIANDHPYLVALNYQNKLATDSLKIPKDTTISNETILFNELAKEEKLNAISIAQSKLRMKRKNLESQHKFVQNMESDIDKYLIEFNRKFALTVTIIVLFFVGAPLGAIVKKGGFGAPVVIAALLFMIYFILISLGENLANNGTLSPFVGMWIPTMILAPVSVWLTRSAMKDRPLFSFSFKRNKTKSA